MEVDADPLTYNMSSYWHIYLYIVNQLFLLNKYLPKIEAERVILRTFRLKGFLYVVLHLLNQQLHVVFTLQYVL